MHNDVIKKQLDHRSIRFYKDKKVEEEKLNLMLEAFIHAPTSSNLQVATVIHITDQSIKDEIAKVSNQPYIKDLPELFISIVDLRRNYFLVKENGYEGNVPGMNLFFQGAADAYIQTQNASLAAESLGLGTVFLGSVLNDPQRIVDLLNLPKYTFPMVGLGFGYPDDKPELKPRIDVSKRYFKNTYHTFDSYSEELSVYDEEMEDYYGSRSTNNRSDTFSHQVKEKFENPVLKRDELLQVVEKQGFNLGLEK